MIFQGSKGRKPLPGAWFQCDAATTTPKESSEGREPSPGPLWTGSDAPRRQRRATAESTGSAGKTRPPARRCAGRCGFYPAEGRPPRSPPLRQVHQVSLPLRASDPPGPLSRIIGFMFFLLWAPRGLTAVNMLRGADRILLFIFRAPPFAAKAVWLNTAMRSITDIHTPPNILGSCRPRLPKRFNDLLDHFGYSKAAPGWR